jgi:hypothetical protein
MYELASAEVVEMGQKIIEKDHRHLLEANITYLFRDSAWKTGGDGRTILGKASKRNEIDKVLSQRKEDFIIIIPKPTWDKMSEDERKCVIDHECCHCGIKLSSGGDKKWFLRKHPIEEFPENLARFSARRDQLGALIAEPPSAIVSKPSSLRRIRAHHDEEPVVIEDEE